ncbi:hypothetical protein Pint_15666 [Pistacia integerrima]|uniref:Uncharacterized protein n=2 Tax=Pistacia integerrima TaxID=434235 RepID=A0ACC0XNN1_9ROSI|nr:hypothetical protein Pint_10824 [Pistacia integerrima]KAJ0047701.1 hypothetical protein Pint_15666 [Pistacia integerrima]
MEKPTFVSGSNLFF